MRYSIKIGKSKAVRESSENYEVMMIQEFQGVQNRHAGRIEEHESDWIRSTKRSTWSKEAISCMNIKFLFFKEKEKNSS